MTQNPQEPCDGSLAVVRIDTQQFLTITPTTLDWRAVAEATVSARTVTDVLNEGFTYRYWRVRKDNFISTSMFTEVLDAGNPWDAT
jgi:cation transporter-like permease